MNNTAIDKKQLKSLLKVQTKIDFRGASNPFNPNAKGSFPPLLGVMIFKFFISIGLAAFVWFVGDIFVGSLMINLMTMTFVAFSILLDFSNLILSPDDFNVISVLPVNSQTFYYSKIINLIFYVTLLSSALGLLPSIAIGIANDNLLLIPVTFVMVWCMSLAIALFFIVFYSFMLKFKSRDKMQRLLAYSQLVVIMFLYACFFVIPRQFDLIKGNVDQLYKWWIYILPPSWFASLPTLLSDKLSVGHILGAIAAIVVILLLYYFGIKRLSLSYASNLAEAVDKREDKVESQSKKGIISRWWQRVASSEDKAVFKLITKQFKYDNRFKMAVLVIIPLTLLYLYLGATQGDQVINPFTIVADSDADSNFLLYIALAIFPIMVLAAIGNSDSFRAAWIFYTTPVNKSSIVLAIKHFVFWFFCLPYILVLTAIHIYYFNNIFHAILHGVTLGLLSLLLVTLLIVLFPKLPFSEPAKKGQQTLTMMIGMFLAPVIIVLPLVIISKIGYGGYFWYLIIQLVLISLNYLMIFVQKRLLLKTYQSWSFCRNRILLLIT